VNSDFKADWPPLPVGGAAAVVSRSAGDNLGVEPQTARPGQGQTW